MTGDRAYDLVLLGATGFTGTLTAGCLAASAPAGTRWALAGRSPDRLRALRDRLADEHAADVDVVVADVTDPASLRDLAASTRVVATTVGPYIRHGEPVVAACAAAGTDYVDLTGEQEFVDLVYARHHATALRTGARIVHACGFDSVPADLGAQFTVGHLPADVPLRVRGYLTAGGAFSGGTFDSAVTAFSRVRQAGAARAARRRVEPPAVDGRRVRVVTGRPGWDPAAGAWVLPLPLLDPHVVARSARALARYGPDFTYAHLGAFRNPLSAAGLAAAAAGLLAAAQVPPARRALLRLRPAGTGPDPERRARGWFRLRFVGEGGGRLVRTEVTGGDPGYDATAAMLAASALCLASDALPSTAGQVTTAVAMGDALRERLQSAGIGFRVVG